LLEVLVFVGLKIPIDNGAVIQQIFLREGSERNRFVASSRPKEKLNTITDNRVFSMERRNAPLEVVRGL
jgi:hypothetical protein